MSAFEDLLKKAVLGLGESFESAKKDLFEETTALSESVERVTAGKGVLALRKTSENPEQTQYTLYVTGAHQVSEITTFFLSAKGYPIKVASEAVMATIDFFDTILSNREDIRKYYNQLASEANSRLVLRIAFLIRKDQPKEGTS
ncbi:MAG TPA: hypothetical protein VEM96_14965 [Pyrinomonadaceae bacterium]|nr:hypothetical protein [Pyrinomonadaceae bacterium]